MLNANVFNKNLCFRGNYNGIGIMSPNQIWDTEISIIWTLLIFEHPLFRSPLYLTSYQGLDSPNLSFSTSCKSVTQKVIARNRFNGNKLIHMQHLQLAPDRIKYRPRGFGHGFCLMHHSTPWRFASLNSTQQMNPEISPKFASRSKRIVCSDLGKRNGFEFIVSPT